MLLTHPDHVTAEFLTTAKQARAFSSVHIMKTGLSISGSVVSPFGRPVPGAAITVAIPRSDGMFVQITTDEKGQFGSGHCFNPQLPGLKLIVHASGLATTFHSLKLTPDTARLVVRLTRRRPLAGSVVDAEGRPVVGAVVACGQDVSYGPLGWETETDAEGHFVWFEAPTIDSFYLRALKPSFRDGGRSVLRPEIGDVTITLHR